MNWADLANGLFELFGGVLLWMNVRKLYRDKEYKGVSKAPVAFFMAWGYWNLYFYPAFGAWLSFFGGLNIVVANTVWLVQMVYYSRTNKRIVNGEVL